MSDITETKKSTARAAAMAKTWVARREFAANPVCCCGCGAKLAVGCQRRHKTPAFLPVLPTAVTAASAGTR